MLSSIFPKNYSKINKYEYNSRYQKSVSGHNNMPHKTFEKSKYYSVKEISYGSLIDVVPSSSVCTPCIIASGIGTIRFSLAIKLYFITNFVNL